MVLTLSRAQQFARRRARATGQAHLVVIGRHVGQPYQVLRPKDLFARADDHSLADILYTADPDQLELALESPHDAA